MSRQSRLVALRSRLDRGIVPDRTFGEVPIYDPNDPIPVPDDLRGSYQTCGRCRSYMAAGVCAHCSKMTA